MIYFWITFLSDRSVIKSQQFCLFGCMINSKNAAWSAKQFSEKFRSNDQIPNKQRFTKRNAQITFFRLAWKNKLKNFLIDNYDRNTSWKNAEYLVAIDSLTTKNITSISNKQLG